MYAAVPGTVYYLDRLPVKSNNACSGPRCCLLPGNTDNRVKQCLQRSQALSIKLLRPPAYQIKECLQKSRVLPITWTACLSGEMMLRDVEGAWVHVVLLGLTVAMVTADVEGATVATVLLVSACFSPGLCLSIVLVTHRFGDGKTVWVKQTLINRRYLND